MNRIATTIAVAALVCAAGARSVAGEPNQVIDVWCDVDTANGVGDVDDGLMLIQGFHSPEVTVCGVSVVYGNTTLERAVPIARDIISRFGPEGLVPQAGAASADDLGRETDAVRAMAAELQRRPMTILAVGPVTNVATLVQRYPELHQRIARIIMVAARRPGQRFISSDRQVLPHRDFNFEHDPAAMQAILDTSIELVFAPWEVSSHVWIDRQDLARLRAAGGSGAWIAESSEYWIARWEQSISSRGFNPFDTLAMGFVTHPQLIESLPVRTWIEQGPDDRVTAGQESAKTKPYLLVEPYAGQGRRAVYCYRPTDEFKPRLLERLAGGS